jgi:signal transduction histidine kinase
MLDAFITANRDTIITRTRKRVSARETPRATQAELANGIPTFLDQLGDALRLAKSSDTIDHQQINESAGQNGRDLLRLGLTVQQVVHCYGDVCQAVSELAVEQKERIAADEFKTLNLCLDDATAAAVTEYAREHERNIADQGAERLGVLAHELRNLLNTATLSFDILKSGRVAVGGSTGLVLSRSLAGLRDLLDLSLADVRLDAAALRLDRISVGEFLEEVELGAQLQAQARGLEFTVAPVDREVTIDGDLQILAAAVSNLLQNAFKFTREHGHVSLTTRLTADRIAFDVEDECGGLPPGKAEELFRPFEQRGSDRSGVGLGLSICLKAAKANGGELRVRDLPGKGCVFTLDLPRKPPRLSAVPEDKDKPKAASAGTSHSGHARKSASAR